MNEATIHKIHAELRDELVGAKFGKIFVLGRDKLAIDMRRENGKYLYVSVNPSSPRIYLIKRKLKDLAKEEGPTGNFAAMLRKRLSNSRLAKIDKIPQERVLEMFLDAGDESLEEKYILVIQLTGRSSNLFLLDSKRKVIDSLRSAFGAGQEKGQLYEVPPHPGVDSPDFSEAFDQGGYESLSEALDAYYLEKERNERFESRAASARALIRAGIKKKKRLEKKLRADLANHGDPEKWKRLGDLLNANISTAKIQNGIVELIDYFDDALPTIELEIGDRHTVTEAAEVYFKKYSKSKNAKIEIKNRLKVVSEELEKLDRRSAELDAAIETGDEEQVSKFLPGPKNDQKKSRANSGVSKYAREFLSSDGLTILVGKGSKDNDYLTFRIAKSLDIWLHAADYSGSHVIIRRNGRAEVPQKTLLEAAMLAAFYSKAKKETKAAVRYAERKFVSKPKGAAPGLVSVSASKTIMVRPGVPDSVSK